jgi:hypothetical protein
MSFEIILPTVSAYTCTLAHLYTYTYILMYKQIFLFILIGPLEHNFNITGRSISLV